VLSETNTSAGKSDDELGHRSLASNQSSAYEKIFDRALDAQANLS